MSSGVNQACVAALAPRGLAWQCFYAWATLPFIKARVFVVNPMYDLWQLENVVVPPGTCLTLVASLTS